MFWPFIIKHPLLRQAYHQAWVSVLWLTICHGSTDGVFPMRLHTWHWPALISGQSMIYPCFLLNNTSPWSGVGGRLHVLAMESATRRAMCGFDMALLWKIQQDIQVAQLLCSSSFSDKRLYIHIFGSVVMPVKMSKMNWLAEEWHLKNDMESTFGRKHSRGQSSMPELSEFPRKTRFIR